MNPDPAARLRRRDVPPIRRPSATSLLPIGAIVAVVAVAASAMPPGGSGDHEDRCGECTPPLIIPSGDEVRVDQSRRIIRLSAATGYRLGASDRPPAARAPRTSWTPSWTTPPVRGPSGTYRAMRRDDLTVWVERLVGERVVWASRIPLG